MANSIWRRGNIPTHWNKNRPQTMHHGHCGKNGVAIFCSKMLRAQHQKGQSTMKMSPQPRSPQYVQQNVLLNMHGNSH
eukprot:6754458-Ditylum_brightwellii.AAC.1